MKKIINLLFIFILSMSCFSACGKNNNISNNIEVNSKTFEATIINVADNTITIVPDVDSDECNIFTSANVLLNDAELIDVNTGSIEMSQLYPNYTIEVTYDGEVNNNSEIYEINASVIKVLQKNISEFVIENVSYDEEWGMYRGNCIEGNYTGEILFMIPDEFKNLEIPDNGSIILESTGGITMSLPPQLFGITNISVL